MATASVRQLAQNGRAKGPAAIAKVPTFRPSEFTPPHNVQNNAQKENAKVKKSYNQEVLVCVSRHAHRPQTYARLPAISL